MSARMSVRICGLAVLMVGAVLASGSEAGNTNAPAAPTDPGSAMFTIEAVYQRLATGATGAMQVFTNPASGPTAGTMHTLNEVMAKAPAADANGATSNDVVRGMTFWGLGTNGWGTNTGVRPLAAVRRTGQTNSYNQAGTVGTGNKDDGEYKKGVALPSPRFTVVDAGASSNCVIDNLTGLMWLKNPDITGRIWTNAIAYCEGLDGSAGRGGYTDWRMPNRRELESLLDLSKAWPALPSGHPFTNVQTYYQSSTTYIIDATGAWGVFMDRGNLGSANKGFTRCVWPVRGGQ